MITLQNTDIKITSANGAVGNIYISTANTQVDARIVLPANNEVLATMGDIENTLPAYSAFGG